MEPEFEVIDAQYEAWDGICFLAEGSWTDVKAKAQQAARETGRPITLGRMETIRLVDRAEGGADGLEEPAS